MSGDMDHNEYWRQDQDAEMDWGKWKMAGDKDRKERLTTKPVAPSKSSELQPEFLRTRDVERLYGIKRGTLYTLHRQGKVKGCLLRVAGEKSGVRLWDAASIRTYINSVMEEQNQ